MIYWSNPHPLPRAGYLQLTCCLSYKLMPHYHSFLWNLAVRDIELMLNNSEKKVKESCIWSRVEAPEVPCYICKCKWTWRDYKNQLLPLDMKQGCYPFDFRQVEDKRLHLLRSHIVSLVEGGGRALWGCDPFRVFRHRLWEARNKILTLLTSTSTLLGVQISRKTRLKPIPNTTG